MAVNALSRLAAAGQVPVYPVIGRHALCAVDGLRAQPDLALQTSPRHASLLLVAGELREEDQADLLRLHDQLPHPRATLWWRSTPHSSFDEPIVATSESTVDQLRGVYRDLLLGRRPSEKGLLPDEPPVPWRDKGDYGQGGEGMMGGKPYGRPMAMTSGDLRDGLALDAYTASFGPFLSFFPPGLKLQVTLQGDVIQSAKIERSPLQQKERHQPLPLIARQLSVVGLAGQALRFYRAALDLEQGRVVDFSLLDRLLRWSGIFRLIPQGLGKLGASDVRARLRRWWQQAAQRDADDTTCAESIQINNKESRLTDLLPGLEWNEAILVINSFDPVILRRLCPTG